MGLLSIINDIQSGNKVTVWLAIIVIFLIFELICFILFFVDKNRAICGRWRISEMTLLIFSFFGPFGAWLGMQLFRHKTQKVKFIVLVTLFIIIRIFIIALAFHLSM